MRAFISYRRSDSPYVVAPLKEKLEARFRGCKVFLDVDNIPIGRSFPQILDEMLATCDYCFVVIGKGWLTESDKEGKRRLDDPHDFVRIEIATALRRGIPVIPVLADHVRVPSLDQLPIEIQDLAKRHAIEVRPPPDFNHDLDRLIHKIAEQERERNPGLLAKADRALRQSWNWLIDSGYVRWDSLVGAALGFVLLMIYAFTRGFEEVRWFYPAIAVLGFVVSGFFAGMSVKNNFGEVIPQLIMKFRGELRPPDLLVRISIVVGFVGLAGGAGYMTWSIGRSDRFNMLKSRDVVGNDKIKRLEYLEEAIKLDPERAKVLGDFKYERYDLWTGLANAAAERQDWQNCVRFQEQALLLNPDMWPLHYHSLAHAYCQLGTIDKAVNVWTQAINRQKNSGFFHVRRGECYLVQKAFDMAIADANMAISLWPRDAAAFTLRGVAYHGKQLAGGGDKAFWDQANKDMAEARNIDPKSARDALERFHKAAPFLLQP